MSVKNSPYYSTGKMLVIMLVTVFVGLLAVTIPNRYVIITDGHHYYIQHRGGWFYRTTDSWAFDSLGDAEQCMTNIWCPHIPPIPPMRDVKTFR